MGDYGSHLSGVRLCVRAAISGFACCLAFFPISLASLARPTQEDGQSKPQSSSLQAPSKSDPTFCGSLWIESIDPRIRTVDLKARLLIIPEFVYSGIAFSRDAEHADLSLKLAVEADDDGNGLEYLIAFNPKTNLWDRTSFTWPAADYEEVIARRAVRLLFSHCVARRDNVPPLSQLPPEMVNQKLVAARTIRPVVHTSWMRDKVLLAALKARPEFAKWGIEVGGVNAPADFDIVVGHVLSTLTWTFQFVDRESGALLDQGSVMAFHDDRAALRIAAATVKRIATQRSLPPSTLGSATSNTALNSVTPEAWVIEAISEDLHNQFPEKMKLTIQNGSLTALDVQGHSLFSISGSSIIDFADTKSFKTLGDNIRFDGDEYSLGCCIPFLLVYGPLLLALDQVHTNLQIFEIAWMEEKTLRVASLKVSKGDYQSLLSHLELLSEAEGRASP